VDLERRAARGRADQLRHVRVAPGTMLLTLVSWYALEQPILKRKRPSKRLIASRRHA